MAIHIEDLMTLAHALLELPMESAWRASISRSYYAVHLRALDWEIEQHIDGLNIGHPGGLHQQLINRLRNPSRPIPLRIRQRAALLACHLEIQRDRRVDADYRLSLSITLADARQQFNQAREALNGCNLPPRARRQDNAKSDAARNAIGRS